jgi:hypothetical protein
MMDALDCNLGPTIRHNSFFTLGSAKPRRVNLEVLIYGTSAKTYNLNLLTTDETILSSDTYAITWE